MLRKTRGLTQEELADLAGVSQSVISHMERDDADGSTLKMFKAVATALEVPLHALFTPDLSLPEQILVEVFRRLPVERQKGWIDMAQAAKSDLPPQDR